MEVEPSSITPIDSRRVIICSALPWYGNHVLLGRPRIVFRLFALALMAVVAGDLLDAACDPFPGLTQPVTIAAGTDTDDDQCTDTCVADCYCCSALDRASMSAPDDPLGFLRMATFVIPPQGPSRTTAPLDQPPTRL